MSKGGVLTWTDFGERQPSFIVSFVPASCPPSYPTRIATPEKRRNRTCGSITLWSSSCFIPCFSSILEMILPFHFQMIITTSLLRESVTVISSSTLRFMGTHPFLMDVAGFCRKNLIRHSILMLFLGNLLFVTDEFRCTCEFLFSSWHEQIGLVTLDIRIHMSVERFALRLYEQP